MHQEDQSFLAGMEDPICFVCCPFYTMYDSQAMNLAGKNIFRGAMIKKIATHL